MKAHTGLHRVSKRVNSGHAAKLSTQAVNHPILEDSVLVRVHVQSRSYNLCVACHPSFFTHIFVEYKIESCVMDHENRWKTADLSARRSGNS